jgi:hypothetical protein
MDYDESLLDWFKHSKLTYTYSHKYKTLSGWHYFFKSNEVNGKNVSVEIFEDEYSGTKSTMCITKNDKAISPVYWLKLSTDEEIEEFDNELHYLEDRV